jgi:hypothetical protein
MLMNVACLSMTVKTRHREDPGPLRAVGHGIKIKKKRDNNIKYTDKAQSSHKI